MLYIPDKDDRLAGNAPPGAQKKSMSQIEGKVQYTQVLPPVQLSNICTVARSGMHVHEFRKQLLTEFTVYLKIAS